jgi:hypothetical protein
MKINLFYNNISINLTWGNINRRAIVLEYLPACFQPLQSIPCSSPPRQFLPMRSPISASTRFCSTKKEKCLCPGLALLIPAQNCLLQRLANRRRKIALYTASLWVSLELNPGQRRNYEGGSESTFTRYIFRGFYFSLSHAKFRVILLSSNCFWTVPAKILTCTLQRTSFCILSVW